MDNRARSVYKSAMAMTLADMLLSEVAATALMFRAVAVFFNLKG